MRTSVRALRPVAFQFIHSQTLTVDNSLVEVSTRRLKVAGSKQLATACTFPLLPCAARAGMELVRASDLGHAPAIPSSARLGCTPDARCAGRATVGTRRRPHRWHHPLPAVCLAVRVSPSARSSRTCRAAARLLSAGQCAEVPWVTQGRSGCQRGGQRHRGARGGQFPQ